MMFLKKILTKLKLMFPDPLEEKEFTRLKAPIIKICLTWLFFFIGLLFVPLTLRYFEKNLFPQNYLGVSFIVCAALVFVFRNKLEKCLEALSLLYVALMIILYIINMRLILKKQAPYEAFYMGYGLALISRMLDYRVGSFIIIAIFHIVFNIVKFTLLPIPDGPQTALIVCLEIFPIILGFKNEIADRVLFDSVYNSKHQLLKFKNFLTECLPSQMVVLAQDYSNTFFSNDAFNQIFSCKNILDIKRSFEEIIIDNQNLDKNLVTSDLLDLTEHDKSQPLTFSRLIDFVTKKKNALQGLQGVKLQATQSNILPSDYFSEQTGQIAKTKETFAKEEDLILLNQERSSQHNYQRSLTAQNALLGPDRMNSSGEAEPQENTNRQGRQKALAANSKRVWNIRLFPILWDAEEALAVLFDDVTYEKTITDLQVADKNKKDLIIALISHELKTPLNGMLGMIDIIKKRLKNIEAVKQTDVFSHLDACKNNSLLLLNLINSIVDFSKIKADVLTLSYSKMSIRELLNKIKPLFEHFCRSKNLYLRIEVSSEVPRTIITDQNRLKQILIYLLGNAFKFTFSGGITLRAQLESKNPCVLRMSVQDTGIGISPEDKQKLFQLFGVTEQKDKAINTHGMGLGLTISNALAKMLHSQEKGLEVESEVDRGSIFSFLVRDQAGTEVPIEISNEEEMTIPSTETIDELKFPMSIQEKMSMYSEFKEKNNLEIPQVSMSNKQASGEAGEINEKEGSKEKPWCLLVDDNPFNLMVAHNIMEERGYRIQTAMNGQEAIQKAQQQQKKEQAFQIILMDCQMPIMDGYESTKTLKRMMSEGQIPECPIVAVTANAKDAKHDRLSEEAGMSGFLAKPLQINELERVLRNIHMQSYQELRSPLKQSDTI